MVPTSSGHRRDREVVRKKVLLPLVDLGVMERVTARPGSAIVEGHPVPKSPYCAYRLTAKVVDFLERGGEWEMGARAREVASSLEVFGEGCSTHEALMDACVSHFAPRHLPGFCLVYRDPRHGPKLDLEQAFQLSAAGLELDPGRDPLPDLVFWDEVGDRLCIVEAVTTEGIVDASRRGRLAGWVERHRPGMEVVYVTAFGSWKVAGRFMKDIARGTQVWVQESFGKVWDCR